MKRKHEEEKENEDRWLLTYADLITLLMAFFLIMFALSKVDSKKFEQIAGSLAGVFPTASRTSMVPLPGIGGQKGQEPSSVMRKPPPKEPSTPPGTPTATEKTPMEKLGDQFRALVQQEGLEGTVSVSSSPGGHRLIVRLSESLLFDPGKATLALTAQALIEKIAAVIAKANKPVRVEGHTDNIPIHTAQFQSNWELSTARAASVIRYMIDNFNFPPETLSASGYGEFRPVAPNDTPENRAKNRRVEFVITDKDEDA